MESSNTMSRAAKPYDDGRKKKSTDPVGGDKVLYIRLVVPVVIYSEFITQLLSINIRLFII